MTSGSFLFANLHIGCIKSAIGFYSIFVVKCIILTTFQKGKFLSSIDGGDQQLVLSKLQWGFKSPSEVVKT